MLAPPVNQSEYLLYESTHFAVVGDAMFASSFYCNGSTDEESGMNSHF